MAMETYCGHVRTPADAIILFEACRLGQLPRVQRRLSEKERQSIKSGSVFVWDEREAGMRRWTDGKSWSASRVSGSFLTYREMEGKRGGGFDKNHSQRDSLGNGELDSDGTPDGYRYKVDGLIKQSFSITANNGQHLHLISYYARSTNQSQSLPQPSSDPKLRHIRPEKGMYPEATVHEQSSIPAVTRGPMPSPQYSQGPPGYHTAGPYPYPHAHGNWAPPSPMHTPPPNYAPYGYQGHPPPPPPPGYAHTSPLQHVQYAPHHGYPHPPAQTAFDRPPPHMQNTALPPPPPAQYGPPTSYPAPYAQHDYPYHGQHGTPYYPPPPTSQPPQPYHTAPPKYPSPEQRGEIHEARGRDAPSRTPPEKRERSPMRLPPRSTSGQTIPSISAMLNGAADGPPVRAKSGSPGNVPPRGPSDIPTHKLGFEANRDMEALRNLDKSTFKGY